MYAILLWIILLFDIYILYKVYYTHIYNIVNIIICYAMPGVLLESMRSASSSLEGQGQGQVGQG